MSQNFLEQLQALPANLSNHLKITIIALVVSLLMSLPLAVSLVRHPRLRYPVLATTGEIQTVPSLALLALMVPLLQSTGGLGIGIAAFGFYPAAIALTLYALLPMLRNMVTGILGVDPAMTEAARGVGMTPRQVLWKVELPLAAPVIIAGIRTSTMWVVGGATLATPVGQQCLGNYIFTGLQTDNQTMVLFGVFGSALLGIVLDLLIGGLEKSSAERRQRLGWVSGGLLGLVILGGLVSPSILDWVRASRAQGPVAGAPAGKEQSEDEDEERQIIRVGAKTFTEQYILSNAIVKRLEDSGIRAETTGSLGSTVIFEALTNGDIDLFVGYSGTIWANAMNRSDMAQSWRVLQATKGWLASEHGVRTVGTLGFENTYMLAMRRGRADEMGIDTLVDLSEHAPSMQMGGDYEYFGRPEWDKVRETYGLRFSSKTTYDSSLMYRALKTEEVDVIAAFSSDGRIRAYDLKLLEDPRGAIPPYHAMLLLGPTIADREDVVKALRPMVGAIPVERMQRANYMVDRDEDKKTVPEAAEWLNEQIDQQ